MPNLLHERQQLRSALNLIANKYGKWITGNHNLMALLGAQQQQFDQMVKFMDAQPFMRNLLLTSRPQSSCTTLGFTDYLTNPPTIYINRTHATPSTLIHELLHYLTHTSFRQHTSQQLNEGITEYFTRKVQGTADSNNNNAQPFQTPRTSYNDELASVKQTRGFIKQNVVPRLPFIRAQEIELGRHRKMAFEPDPAGGVDTDDFVKRAYFKGEMAMINLLKEYSTL